MICYDIGAARNDTLWLSSVCVWVRNDTLWLPVRSCAPIIARLAAPPLLSLPHAVGVSTRCAPWIFKSTLVIAVDPGSFSRPWLLQSLLRDPLCDTGNFTFRGGRFRARGTGEPPLDFSVDPGYCRRCYPPFGKLSIEHYCTDREEWLMVQSMNRLGLARERERGGPETYNKKDCMVYGHHWESKEHNGFFLPYL